MKQKRLLIITILLFYSFACWSSGNQVLDQMCYRLFPLHAEKFHFQLNNKEISDDYFTLESQNDKIVISGNNTNSLAVGVNYYLKNYCYVNISWYASDSVYMPQTLPSVAEKIMLKANCDQRFFLNYCTYGYTMPYWGWTEWERLIDWMALNGVTMPLAITGQESVWYKVWSQLGLSDSQIRSYFTGPAHLPWHRMSNVDYWQGPLPMSWIKQQEELQKKILERERSFGMTPVLSAFSGHVPKELQTIYPNAQIHKMSEWGGFDDIYRSHFIDPSDSLYSTIQKLFLEEQTKLYGTDHIYACDPFNEVDSPNWDEQYLSDVSAKIYESMTSVDPDAKWLQMTWMFYYDKKKWTQPRIRAFLRGVPQDKLVLLDYFCDNTEFWDETEHYYGQPYIWCYLGNFGGNTMIIGNLNDIDQKITRVLKEGGTNLAGLGCTLEGLDVNPLMYEFVLSRAWETISAADWVQQWAACRGGDEHEAISKAWQKLYTYIYTKETEGGQAVLMNARPMLEGTEGWNTKIEYHYDNQTLWKIWKDLLQADNVSNPFYRQDIVNVGRQVLGNLFADFRTSFTNCYLQQDKEGLEKWAKRMDQLLLDADRLLACEESFSMGKWINSARQQGTTSEEKDYFEENARTILSIWGQKGSSLNDYANRGWSGLTKSFYRERWSRFTKAVINALTDGKEFDQQDFRERIIEFEYDWTKQKDVIDITSGEDAVRVAQELFKQYKSYFNKKP